MATVLATWLGWLLILTAFGFTCSLAVKEQVRASSHTHTKQQQRVRGRRSAHRRVRGRGRSGFRVGSHPSPTIPTTTNSQLFSNVGVAESVSDPATNSASFSNLGTQLSVPDSVAATNSSGNSIPGIDSVSDAELELF